MNPSDLTSSIEKIVGHSPTKIDAIELPGGASNRRYFRVSYKQQSWVVMVLADEPLRSEEAVHGPTPTELPFVEIQTFLSGGGVSVPKIHLFDREQGHLWLDDLGDTTLFDVLEPGSGPERITGYKSAIELLVDFQKATREERDRPICYQRRFEAALLQWELEHYIEWRVETQLETQISDRMRLQSKHVLSQLVVALTSLPYALSHRDFQSTNLMASPKHSNRLVLIDFQDALMAPYCYDLVSLLRDSYIDLTCHELDELIDYYLGLRPDLNASEFRRAFDMQTVQRKLKDAGRFVYIDRVKGDNSYLKWIRPTLRYVREALERQTELQPLQEILAALDPQAFA